MQIISFLSHYQLVYISFDISSFSLISYIAKRASFTLQKSTFCDWVVNLSYKRGEGEIKQFTSDLFYISSNKQRGTLLHLHISFISLGLPEYQKQI